MAEYLYFVEDELPPSRRTREWTVCSKLGVHPLGRISWMNAWRRYAFFPDHSTTFDAGCLREVVVFIETQMVARRERPSV